MKKTFLLFSIIASALGAKAQAPVDSLHENFDVACVLATTGGPATWMIHNAPTSAPSQGAWHCGPTDGRDGTPGEECTGTYSSAYHLDTSYLVTPLLYIHNYTGKVYLRFDTKTTNIHLGGELSIIKADGADSSLLVPADDTDITAAALPLIGNGDSSNWVTHQIDISSFKDAGAFYLAFRYTSTTVTGSIWYLDNINTDTVSHLGVTNIAKEILPISIIGAATTSQINFSYTAKDAGNYQLTLYDMMGQVAYKKTLKANEGESTYTLNNLNLHPGMYFIRMNNESSYGTAKVMIQ